MARVQPGKPRSPQGAKPGGNGATTGYEADLWRMADALRGSMDAAEYKHVVLGLIFLKYISDAFEERHATVLSEWGTEAAEDRDEYIAENIFWVPQESRWANLKAQARQPTVGQLVDGAMADIERDNPTLKDVLPKDYARPALDKQRLGQLIDLISNIRVGDREARSKDVLGRVYEYFLSQFASAEGKKGGEFYTPRCVVKLLVEMLEPYRGRVYDPCCGSSGMFVQSMEFIPAHASGNGNGGQARSDISIYGQESNYTTWRLAKMNLAIRGIEGQIANGDSFHNDRHPDLKADFILANPPFNVSDWGGERLTQDQRWQYGVPPKGNANFAWVQHMVYHLSPAGAAGFVLANGSMSSSQSNEGNIRRSLIEANLVDCMVALPGQLFYSTQIPACLWFLARRRERSGEILFIDGRKLGRMVDRTHRELTDEDIARIADTYHAWRNRASATSKGEERGEGATGEYADIPGFCKSATLEEVRKQGHVLTPGRYVGAEIQEDDGEPFEDKMKRLTAQWRKQQAEAAKLDAAIEKNLKQLGFGNGEGI
ncbi:MAG: SAM-dependent DNA methyltransferase [Acidobacteria bacterium]|nr:SAM-dependent DNA methyltransferase [Acidobacteriota bacterium]